MDSFSPSEFFDLSAFAHPSLFAVHEPVWLALSLIAPYLAAAKLGIIEGTVEKGAILVNPETISIGKGTVVEAGAYIKGPCIIGEKCEVRHGAYMRGNVIVGNRCVIGHATEVKNSIFLDGSHAGHFAYVGDSILGNNVNLGAGVKCANLRFDGKPIRIGSHPTGLRKCGAILGDKVQLGCNSVTNPGTVVGKGSLCVPCMNISGVIAPLSILKPKKVLHAAQ